MRSGVKSWCWVVAAGAEPLCARMADSHLASHCLVLFLVRGRASELQGLPCEMGAKVDLQA